MHDSHSELHETLIHIVHLLVDRPDEATVVSLPSSQPFTFQILVCDSDLGKVIGKQGRTARAIRTLVAAHTKKVETPVAIDIARNAN